MLHKTVPHGHDLIRRRRRGVKVRIVPLGGRQTGLVGRLATCLTADRVLHSLDQDLCCSSNKKKMISLQCLGILGFDKIEIDILGVIFISRNRNDW